MVPVVPPGLISTLMIPPPSVRESREGKTNSAVVVVVATVSAVVAVAAAVADADADADAAVFVLSEGVVTVLTFGKVVVEGVGSFSGSAGCSTGSPSGPIIRPVKGHKVNGLGGLSGSAAVIASASGGGNSCSPSLLLSSEPTS